MNKAINEIRGQDTAELKAKLTDLRKEQFKLRFHGSAEEVAKTTRHREVRRTIARILMVLGDRTKSEQGDSKPGAAAPAAPKAVPAKAAPAKAANAKKAAPTKKAAASKK